MPLTYRQISKILADYDFQKIRQKGSHQRFQTVGSPYRVTVNETKEFKPKTAKSILDQIALCKHISTEDIIKKYNIKL